MTAPTAPSPVSVFFLHQWKVTACAYMTESYSSQLCFSAQPGISWYLLVSLGILAMGAESKVTAACAWDCLGVTETCYLASSSLTG